MLESVSRNSLTSLFLSQSFDDCREDFRRSLAGGTFPHWDAVIITASNESQAEGYRLQLEYRRSMNRLPPATEFIIVPDKDNRRVGSAGSTLSVIRELKERYGDFSGRRFLCIHAGGDSKRCPQYSALGKLFSPVPVELDSVPAALFDMFLVTMSSVPGRLREGMLLLSGDVILLFNPLMCDFGTSDAAVISFKEPAETGKDHGVYVGGKNGNVRKFLHKQTVDTLIANGAVDERGNCSIDTGAIELSPVILEKLYSLVDSDEKYEAMVNDRARLSLYGDIAYCLAEDSSLDAFYNEAPEGEFCDELTTARTDLWNAVGSFNMKLLNLAPARFIHFGTVGEIMRLMNGGVEEFSALGWSRIINSSVRDGVSAGYNSVLSSGASVGKGCYLENSYVHRGVTVGDNVYLSFMEVEEGEIPSDVVVHGLKLRDGRFVCRIWPADADPRQSWDEKRYLPCATMREALASSLRAYACGFGFDDSERLSLSDGFAQADSGAVLDWSRRMEELVRMDTLAKHIRDGIPASESRFVLNGAGELTKIQRQWLDRELSDLDLSDLDDFAYAMRLYYYLGVVLDDEKYTSACFRTISDAVQKSALKGLRYNSGARIVRDEITVKLPLRVNFGGGWTDTCPHCLEHGGAVINAAITLGGEYPVEVRLVRVPEHRIVFDSRDMDVHGEFTDIVQLQNTGDPYDPFALQKACLLACGIIPKEGGSLEDILSRLGGGFEMHSEVTDVPKGSGLGTSSILSAAAVKAMFEFTGVSYSEDILYSTVLAMEQIMSTGGGWQDQVGGLTPGIKFITSRPGIEQKLNVVHVNIPEAARKELSERFAIIYTGQRRLARNLLRDVVGRYVGGERDSLIAHREIQSVAARMRAALEKGDINEFAALLDGHWKLSRMIDSGSTNTLIDQIFMCIDDLIDARMVCGAGGGGFLQVILKKGITTDDVHVRLKDVFQDFAVDVWESSILY